MLISDLGLWTVELRFGLGQKVKAKCFVGLQNSPFTSSFKLNFVCDRTLFVCQ